MFQDREYQVAAVQSVPDYFSKKSGNPLIAMPTGTGKSIVIARLLQYIFQWPGQRVLIMTHVKELIAQNYEKLMHVWPNAPAGIYSAGLGKRDRFNNIIFCGVQSVAKRASEFGKVDLILIDEAHLVSPEEETNYRLAIETLKTINPYLKVIGLTATPYRLGYGKLVQEGSLFTDICFDLTTLQAFNWLLAEGYLTTLEPKATKLQLDTSDVKLQGGEFQQKALQLAVDRDEITAAAIQEALDVGSDREHWLVFCAGVEHAVHTAKIMNEQGIKTVAIHSKLSTTERDNAIKLWKSGYYRAATNNNVLTTGIDFPGIDLIVMLRPTKSSVLWVQMLGRGTRPMYSPGFDVNTREGRLLAIQAGAKPHGCLVLDFAGNTARLGPINDPVIPGKKGEKGGEAPAKLCVMCNTWNHTSARNCFKCGAEFTFQVKIKPTADTMQLIKEDMPITEVFEVKSIVYDKWEKPGKAPAIMTTYYCTYKRFVEWVPVEGIGSLRGLAKRWWKDRAPPGLELPDTVHHTLALLDRLTPVTHVRVWVNKKPYPQILAYCYDGTAFGTQAANQTHVDVKQSANVTRDDEVDKSIIRRSQHLLKSVFTDMDDDIPF